MLTYEHIQQFIADKAMEIFKNGRLSDFELVKQMGRHELLDELRMFCLMKENPHNREDIKKFNEKNKEAQ